MEIGTTIISTQEYMELRAMKDNLEARKAEIEANADMVVKHTNFTYPFDVFSTTMEFIGKDEALQAMQDTVTALSIEVQKNDHAKISRTLTARLRFLFTGNLTKVKE